MYLFFVLFFFFSILLFSVYSIMYDELVLSCAQLRSGPFNLGYYGIFSSLVNGLNLVISQFLIPKLHITFGFQFFPIWFMFFALLFCTLIHPFFLVDVYIGLLAVPFRSSFSTHPLILTAFTGCSKHTILGSIRIISQLISFELLTSTLIIFISFGFNDLPIRNYYFQLH